MLIFLSFTIAKVFEELIEPADRTHKKQTQSRGFLIQDFIHNQAIIVQLGGFLNVFVTDSWMGTKKFNSADEALF